MGIRHEEHFIEDGVEVKRCCACHRALPTTLKYFGKDKNKWDKLNCRCRECRGGSFLKEVKEGYKICNKCGRELEKIPKNFHKHGVIKDGFESTCRECKGIIDLPIAKEGFKICTKCLRELPSTHDYFYYNKNRKDGFNSECRECRGTQFATNVIPKSTKEGYKICTCCGEELPFSDFNKHSIGYLGLRPTCKKCRSINRKTEKVRAQRNISHQKRRALKKSVITNYSQQDWDDCLKYFNYQCVYCGENKDVFHKDHVIPISKGGGFVPSNIVCACESCNIAKGNRDIFKWFRKQPFYSLEREKKIREFINCNKGEPIELALF